MGHNFFRFCITRRIRRISTGCGGAHKSLFRQKAFIHAPQRRSYSKPLPGVQAQIGGRTWGIILGSLAALGLCYFIPINTATPKSSTVDKHLREQSPRVFDKSKLSSLQDELALSPDDIALRTQKSDYLGLIYDLKNQIAAYDLSYIGDVIGDRIIPEWLRSLPDFFRSLQIELSMAPGSLAETIWSEASDPTVNPEIEMHSSVRVSENLCPEEITFLERRKHHMRISLAKYLDVPVQDIEPEDLPVIAICGSGGGVRAMVAGTSSLYSANEDGLFDCVTYTAGVSGSCWLQSLFYSSIGRQSHSRVIEHLKRRLGVHIAYPTDAISLISTAPTNKFLLSGLVERMRGDPDADFGLVDIYGLLLGARLMISSEDTKVDSSDLKISEQRKYVEDGAHPLPIYTAVRHEIPVIITPDEDKQLDAQRFKVKPWFQWFEWTPYEFYSEDFGAGIPSWAVGRTYNNGTSQLRESGLALPEIRMSVLLGIWGSAFCATLSHYYKEIRPIFQGLVGFKGIDELIGGKDDELSKMHPFDPATIPNFLFNMKDSLPPTCPATIHDAKFLRLMDAGMTNNLPLAPVLRPARKVDIIIAFDASADVKQDNWLKATNTYVQRRKISGWPSDSGWPEQLSKEVSNAVESRLAGEKNGIGELKDLGHCTIWIGNKDRPEDEGPPSPSLVKSESQLLDPSAGIAVIYFPLLANPLVPGVDPRVSDFLSTWNFVYTPEEVDKVVALAKANFQAGREQTREAVRAVWQRKKRQRLDQEHRAKVARLALDSSKHNQYMIGDQGDQFS